ncbi:helicase-associated domain-containing protein [Herbiconiux sp. CPCC 203407]|uniref:Helicase-associated domain-containing protein n=1 Tax=Herbiconiux oxytropis TaxID=2970915 RepID=A0AA42BRZ5_9MICO|nr:helicase-associated domain-containing protein [Herbiconiux oxytropis]MCS5721063.1 helicase-associated domain-containing protein [Herbiconiux oxytropis]MCS5724715.1 helicase-associated domain-containing protein [Herbiconiux oxytropis]
MSDPLTLARSLSAKSDDQLIALLAARPVAAREIRDFFDLADALLDPVSVRAALRRLDRDQIEGLAAPAENRVALDALPLEELALRDEAGRPYAVVAEVARTLLDEPAPAPETGPPTISPAADALAATPVAERAFTAISAVAELVQQLRLAPVRTLARGGIPAAESKRLSALLGLEPELVPPLMEVARAAGLIDLDGDLLFSTAFADEWNLLGHRDRWSTLVSGWVASLDTPFRSLLADAVEGGRWPSGATLREALATRYPAADATMSAELHHIDELALLLGAAPSGLAAELPDEVDRVYLQHDLSIIAPGPLRPAIDARLRTVADIENRGLASSYRITAQTIDRALASGETAEGLREFLGEISLTGVPQALDYLIGEGERRHGLVRVSPVGSAGSSRRTRVHSSDTRVLGSIAVDQSLASLGFRRESDDTLSSRIEPATVYWLLADARYPVLAEDADGGLLVMRRARILPTRRGADALHSASGAASGAAADAPPALTQELRHLLPRLRSASGGGPPPHDDDAAWISRQLDRAVRSRTAVGIELRMPDGSTTEMQVTPQSLANGRLRLVDERAGVERTVPVANITRVHAL